MRYFVLIRHTLFSEANLQNFKLLSTYKNTMCESAKINYCNILSKSLWRRSLTTKFYSMKNGERHIECSSLAPKTLLYIFEYFFTSTIMWTSEAA